MTLARAFLLGALGVLASAGSATAQCPDGTPPPCASQATRAPAPRSVAVLYFDNLSLDTADAYLASGLTEEMIVRLGQIERLNVKSRHAVQRLRGRTAQEPVVLGRQLGVAYLVSGSVRRSGSRVRVTVELVRTSNGVRVWGDVFDRDDPDLMAIEADIASAVATAVAGRLAPAERALLAVRRTPRPEAYDQYLRGLYFWERRTRADLERARDAMERATQLDTTFALAYADLANVYSHLGSIGGHPPRDVSPKARAAALRALELNSGLAEAHAALAYVKYHYDWDWLAAERSMRRALDLNPRYIEGRRVFAYWLVAEGREREGVAEAERALALDPLDHVSNLDLGRVLLLARGYDRALAQAGEMLARDSGDTHARLIRAMAYQRTGRRAESIAEFRRGGDTSAAIRAAGDRDALLQEIERLSREPWVPALQIARDYAVLQDPDRTFEWLERAYEQHDGNIRLLHLFPEFDDLRSDPRYARLQRRVRP